MSIVSAIRKLLAAGMDIDTALAAAEAFEAEVPALVPALTARQARNRRYYERRLKASETSEPKTPKTDQDASKTVSDDPAPHTCAQVVNTTSSLRSEAYPPVKPNGLTAPKGAETARGTRLPESWEPDETGWRYAAEILGPDVDPSREFDRFRDYWRAVPGAKGRKTDWPATWRNWCRNAAERLPKPRQAHDRPDPDAKQAARHANYARAFEGSLRASGQRWEP